MSNLSKVTTPRPWNYLVPTALDYRAALIYDEDEKSLIAQMCGGGRVRAINVVEERANAALIVRAVNSFDDLVAALRHMRSLYKSLVGPDDRMANVMLEECDAALAKAEGREP